MHIVKRTGHPNWVTVLCLLLSICFTGMFTYSYVPSSMIKSIIVPLIQNKCDSLAHKNNYRSIALSSIALKVFEHVFLCRLEEYLWTNDNQFRFTCVSLHTPLIFVFMLLQSLLSNSKVDPPQYTWHSLTLARPLTKLVTGHFKIND